MRKLAMERGSSPNTVFSLFHPLMSIGLKHMIDLMIVHNMIVKILTSLGFFMTLLANFAECCIIRNIVANTICLGDWRSWHFVFSSDMGS